MTGEPTRTPSVLVVDDEPGICALLERYLGARGLTVRTAHDGASMRQRLRDGPVDAVLLDVNMPGEGGLSLLAWLRSLGDLRPVILLTSRHELSDRVGGVRAGADDYVVKPFEPRELLARLRAVLRRCPPAGAAQRSANVAPIRLGRCWYDPIAHRLSDARDGADVPLTAGESEVLRNLVRRAGMTVERARLAEAACGSREGRGLDAHIMRLRRKLEPDPARPAVIVTRSGQGYAVVPGAGGAKEA